MLYDYYCIDCERTYEVIIPYKDYDKKEKVNCPDCEKELKKYIGKVHLSSKRTTFGY